MCSWGRGILVMSQNESNERTENNLPEQSSSLPSRQFKHFTARLAYGSLIPAGSFFLARSPCKPSGLWWTKRAHLRRFISLHPSLTCIVNWLVFRALGFDWSELALAWRFRGKSLENRPSLITKSLINKSHSFKRLYSIQFSQTTPG